MLLRVWTSEQYRPTKDLDLLAILDLSPEKLIETFQEVCTLSVQDDGLEFLGNTIRVSEIEKTMLTEVFALRCRLDWEK